MFRCKTLCKITFYVSTVSLLDFKGDFMPKKLDPLANSNSKLLRLYALLLSADGELTTNQITESLNCSKQTVSRLVDSINSELNNCIKINVNGRVKSYYIEHYRSGLYDTLDPEGLTLIQMCSNIADGILTTSDKQKLNQTLEKALAYMPRASKGKELDIFNICKQNKGYIRYDNFDEVINRLKHCILKRHCCKFSYRKTQRAEPKEYIFAPLEFKLLKDVLYVAGYLVEIKGYSCQKIHEGSRCFCVHRIVDVEELEATSSRIPYEPGKNQGFYGFMKAETVKVQVKFDKSVESYITDRIWSDDQHVDFFEDGSFMLTFTVQSVPELISFVLSFGNKAELVSPDELRNEIQRVIVSMRELYL